MIKSLHQAAEFPEQLPQSFRNLQERTEIWRRGSGRDEPEGADSVDAHGVFGIAEERVEVLHQASCGVGAEFLVAGRGEDADGPAQEKILLHAEDGAPAFARSIDSSAWIKPYNVTHPSDVFPSLWKRPGEHVASGHARSPRQAVAKCSRGASPLASWLGARTGPKLDESPKIQALAGTFVSDPPTLLHGATHDAADPWVIEHGEVLGYYVVSEERRSAPHETPRIPNVCTRRSIEHVTGVGMLRLLQYKFWRRSRYVEISRCRRLSRMRAVIGTARAAEAWRPRTTTEAWTQGGSVGGHARWAQNHHRWSGDHRAVAAFLTVPGRSRGI